MHAPHFQLSVCRTLHSSAPTFTCRHRPKDAAITDLTRCLTAVSNCSRRTCLRSCSRRPTHSGLLGSDRRST